MNQNKVFYVQLILLAVVVGFFFYYHQTKDKGSFGSIMDTANLRLDSIAMEIKKSKDIINSTNSKLDSIHNYINTLKSKQAESNVRVADNDDKLRKDLFEKNKELNNYKRNYETIKKERDLISVKLDSLADIIGQK